MGPKDVHVAHAVIDGVIDIPRTKGWDLGEGGKIEPDAVSNPSYSFPLVTLLFAISMIKVGYCHRCGERNLEIVMVSLMTS